MTLTPVRLAAGLTATVAWGALGLQLVLIVEVMTASGETVPAAVWRFFGFFTILTNLLVAVVASAMTVKPRSFLAAGSGVRLATAAAILLVGLVYSVALRAVWTPVGLQAVADHALHDATPLLFLATWLAAEHGALTWRDAGWAVPWPLAYVVYAMARGAADGWYAYWFMDPSAMAPAQMAGSIAVLTAVVMVIGLVLVGLDKALARRGGERH